LQALSFYNLAGASIDKTTLKHVAKVCAGVELRDHLVDVLVSLSHVPDEVSIKINKNLDS